MAILNCSSLITKPQILAASSADQLNDSLPPLPPTPSPSISRNPNHLKSTKKIPSTNASKLRSKLSQTREGARGGSQPSIIEIERAIGAGIFRERDVDSDSEGEEKERWMETVMRKSIGKKEGALEKKLKESGQWLTYQAERTSRSAEKQILVAMFVWFIPLWMLGFVVASGFFQIPFLEDFIS